MSLLPHDSSPSPPRPAAAPPGPPIDRAQLLNRCLDDADFVRQLLELFASITPQQATQLHDACVRGDHTEALRMAHTLKGSAANLAATRLRDAAGELETLFRADRPADACALLPKLDDALRECLGYVPTLIASLDPE